MKYFKLFACCKIVKGAKRSLIMDLQRGTFEAIPNDLFTFIVEHNRMSDVEIEARLSPENLNIVSEYYKYHVVNEYGFWCDSIDEFDRFPDMSDEWDSPYLINNAIIDIGVNNNLDYAEILKQFSSLRVPHLQLRSTFDLNFQFYIDLIKTIEKSNIISVQLVIPYPKLNIPITTLKKFLRANLRISSLTFHGSPFYKVVKVIGNLSYIYFVKRNVISTKDCGIIRSKDFGISLSLYTESLNFNTCLNRKIGIDADGEIRNCPSMTKSFGNIKNKSLFEALNEDEFRSLWKITKDQIDVCKDCEFRYLCTDCRANIKDTSNIFSQPARCNYNPYIAKWKGEKGFVSIEKWLKGK
jgi:SPASM domain peptide maturase of grasp-with-spasm system